MIKNKECTKFYSTNHESSIARAIGGETIKGSGNGHFTKGDVVHEGANMVIEAKCTMTPKKSISIKKEWIDKNKKESLAMRKSNQAICINFEPNGENYYLINESLFKFLIDKLTEENS